jgi:signal transduction histidine kinase
MTGPSDPSGGDSGGPAVDDGSALLGAAAHEIKNALGPLAVTLELAERQLLAGQSIAPADVAFARSQVRRISRLVVDLMDLTRADLGQLSVEPAIVDLGAVVSAAIEIFKRGQSPSLRLTFSPPDRPLFAAVDAVRIEQVLLNLLENAVRYAPVGSPIAVELGRRGDRARLAVRDGGPGVPAAERARVFDRFVRGSASKGTGGLGVGLYLCREIVERHAGSIGVDSPPGQGATFWFELPCR